MPKIKTVKGVKDRLRVTRTGKMMGFRAGRRHLLAHRRAKNKRPLRRAHLIASVDAKKLKQLLPYG